MLKSRWTFNILYDSPLWYWDIVYDKLYAIYYLKDIDTMYKNLDFTYNTVNFSDLPIYVEVLQEQGIRVVIILVITFWPVI